MIRVYDWQGNERDLAYLHARYGAFEIRPAADGPGPAWRVAVLRERAESAILERAEAAMVVNARDQGGAPLPGVTVAWYWSDAPLDPNAGPLGGGPGRCFTGTTGDNGDVGFGMGRGAYYYPAKGQVGPHSVWIYGIATRSDLVAGLGMISETNHYHFNIEYVRDNGGGGGTEPPEGSDVPKFFDEAGIEQDADWARAQFGVQEFHQPAVLPTWKLVRLDAASGTAKRLLASARDDSGTPTPGVNLVLYRRNVEDPAPRYAITDANGLAEFDMTGYIEHSAIDGQGQYAIGVSDGASDFYNTAGVVMIKPKQGPPRWLEPTFKHTTGAPPIEPPINPPPSGGPYEYKVLPGMLAADLEVALNAAARDGWWFVDATGGMVIMDRPVK